MTRWTVGILALAAAAPALVLAVPSAARQADQTAPPTPEEAVAEAADATPEPADFADRMIEIYSRSDPNSTILLKNVRRVTCCGEQFLVGEGVDVGAERGDEWMEGRRVWHAAADVSLIIEFEDEQDYLGALGAEAPEPKDQAITWRSTCDAGRPGAGKTSGRRRVDVAQLVATAP